MLSLPKSWNLALGEEMQKPYFHQLTSFLASEKKAGKTIYPPQEQVFACFDHCSPENVRVVIMGQDPYHNPGQANGMSFSVAEGVRIPPSLKNIYQEIQSDTGETMPSSGDLSRWATKGVLLLNTTLTVEHNAPFSHSGKGWEEFTKNTLSYISEQKEGIVFLLWGAHAKSLSKWIDEKKHHILTAPHPSPLSARRGFFGCRHFSKANQILRDQRKQEIEW